MTSREIAVVGCRLMAIYYFINAIYSPSGSLGALVAIFATGSEKVGESFDWLLYYNSLSIFLFLAIALILWFGAKRIAKSVVSGETASTSTGTLKFEDLQSIAFSAVGLFLLVNALPAIVGLLYQMQMKANLLAYPNKTSFTEYGQIVQTSIEAGLGVILLLWGRTLSGMLLWFREYGVKSKTSN